MKLVIDLSTNTVVGGTTDDHFVASSVQQLIDAPEDFEMASAAEWSFDGVEISRDPVAALGRAKAARIARIKAEAGRLIVATDWRLERARERQDAGWGTLAQTDVVMAQREAIRRSSDLAEAAVDAMTDPAAVHAFTWSVEVEVDPQRRLSHKAFSDLFTAAELQAILGAAESSTAVRAWWEKFKLAKDVNMTDPATLAGVQALEIAGLIGDGRAAEILA